MGLGFVDLLKWVTNKVPLCLTLGEATSASHETFFLQHHMLCPLRRAREQGVGCDVRQRLVRLRCQILSDSGLTWEIQSFIFILCNMHNNHERCQPHSWNWCVSELIKQLVSKQKVSNYDRSEQTPMGVFLAHWQMRWVVTCIWCWEFRNLVPLLTNKHKVNNPDATNKTSNRNR